MASNIRPSFPPPPSALDEYKAGTRQIPVSGTAGVAGGGKQAKPLIGQTGSRGGVSSKANKQSSKSGVDGEAFFRVAMVDVRVRTARGESCWAIFDLDNTLCGTRARTLAIAKAFDLKHDTQYFRDLTLDGVGYDGEDTCKRLRLSKKVTQAFGLHWEAAFWRESNFLLDQPIKKTIALVRMAEMAGAEIIYLTSRVEARREATLLQLKRLGLPSEISALYCKPDGQTATEVFKAQQIEKWAASGVHLAWYLTDSRREIAFMQKRCPDLRCVLLETPFQPSETEVRSDTPILKSED